MNKFVVAVSAWGDSYCRLFLGPVLASHRRAIARLSAEHPGIEVRYVVRTDRPVEVARALSGYDLTLMPPPSNAVNIYWAMSETHSRGIDVASHGDRVVLTNADMILSDETFAAIETHFRNGYRAIVCSGARTKSQRLWLNVPRSAAPLSRWSVDRIHPISRSCIWGEGNTGAPWVVYFREGDNIVLRGFHLHPMAVVKDRELPFSGTIDLSLIDNFKFEEIKLIQNLECSFAEISAKGKTSTLLDFNFDAAQIVAWAMRGARPMHWWNFRHRVAIVGNPDSVTIDQDVATEVLSMCPYREAIEDPI
jgi:hypothetical protein